MKRLLNDPAFMFLLLVAAICLFAAFPAYAGGDDITQSNDMNNQTAGDVNVAGDKGGRALAWSMGDVDIGQCLAHKATLVYTWPTENRFCQAQWLISAGYVDAGEHLLCTKTKLVKIYDDYDTCRAALIRVEPYPEPVAAPAPAAEPVDDDHDDSEIFARLAALEAQRVKDAEVAQRAANRARAAAEKAEAAERDRREYAQQTLEELKQWN